MRFASLGSGSRGNALIVDAGDTKLLLDCGFSTRLTIERLSRLGVQPEEISALLVTHEHSDHSAGVFKFAHEFAPSSMRCCRRRWELPEPLSHRGERGSLRTIGSLPLRSPCASARTGARSGGWGEGWSEALAMSGCTRLRPYPHPPLRGSFS